MIYPIRTKSSRPDDMTMSNQVKSDQELIDQVAYCLRKIAEIEAYLEQIYEEFYNEREIDSEGD